MYTTCGDYDLKIKENQRREGHTEKKVVNYL